MPSPATLVRKRQQEWAESRGIAVAAPGYTQQLEDNLFVPLSAPTREDFAAGDGNELGRPGQRAKMQALHSSSALACNVFEYWRQRDAAQLGHALGLVEGVSSIRFEQGFPTGLPGNSPNLDVVLTSPSGQMTAIECKFLEPYGSHDAVFKSKYFESSPGLWEAAGFLGCQALAEQLYSGDLEYRWLSAEQLLKHILGLHRGPHEQWALLYLWYEVPGAASDEHASEAEAFASVAVGDGIPFRALSYQSVFRALKNGKADLHRDYLAYLGGRYFAESV